MKSFKKFKAFITSLLISLTLIAPSLVLADYQALSIVGNPLTASTAPYLLLSGMTGQSACTVSILAPFGGTVSVEGLYQNTTNAQWTGPLTVYTPDGTTTTGTTIAAAGSYIFNCGNMSAIRADGTATTGTPTVTLNASGGVNVIAKIPSTGGGGTVTAVTATGPIVSSGGTTPNISCPTCDTGPFVSSVTAGTSGNITAAPTTGAVVVDEIENPTFTGTVTSSGTGIANTAPNGFFLSGVSGASNSSRGYFMGSTNGSFSVLSDCAAGMGTDCTTAGVYGSSFALLNTGSTALLTIDGSGNVGADGYLAATNLASSAGDCLQATTNGEIVATAAACGTGSGTVTSVTGTTNQIAVATGTTTPVISIPSNPTLPGTTTVGNLINSGLTASECIGTNGTKQETSNTNCVQTVTGTANQVTITGTATPTLSLPTTLIAPGTFAATTSITDSGLTTGQCVQIGTAGLLTGTGVACGSGSGTLTGVTAGTNIVVSTPSPTSPTVSVTNAPSFTGNVGSPEFASTGMIPLCWLNSVSTTDCQESNGSFTVSGIPNNNWGVVDVGNATGLLALQETFPTAKLAIAGSFVSSALTSTDCLQAGVNGIIANAAASCVTSVSGTGLISSTGGTTPVISFTGTAQTATAPTLQKFLTGTGTYTTPAGVRWIHVLAVGAGGGGGGSNGGGTGGTGGSTTFGTTLITSAGGVGGTAATAYGGLGGVATLAAGPLGTAVNGGDGSPTFATGGGGNGGSSCLGGAGSGTGNALVTAALAGATNSGGGGGGSNGATGAGNGGGSGACINVVIDAPLATYSYAVGAAGTAGTAGAAGVIGGAGGSGVISVEEHYNY